MRSFCFMERRARGSESGRDGEYVNKEDARLSNRSSRGLVSTGSFYEEEIFRGLLGIERKKAERSRRPFLLMLINLDHLGPREKTEVAPLIAESLFTSSRETDVKGWYKTFSLIGIIFTDPNKKNDITCFQDMIFHKVCEDIKGVIGGDRYSRLEVELDVFPRDFVDVNSRAGGAGVRGG